MRKFLPSSKRGFTLIELLVVITIIAFLSVIGMVAFNNVQAQARDAKRRADIDAIAKALEANRTDPINGTYLAFTVENAATLFANGVIPQDPINATYGGGASPPSYVYTVTPGTANATTFVACARLEKGSGNSSSGTSIDTIGTLSFYCRKNQQ